MLGVNRNDATTSGVGSAEATDQSRRTNNLIRYGVVKEADYSNAMIRVETQGGEITSDWIPWASMRAGNDKLWDPVEVGEVVMLLSPSGELANAVALPAVFSGNNQNGDRAGLHRRTYEDGTVVEYDRQAHRLTVDTTGSSGSVVIKTQTARIEAAGAVEVEAQGQVTLKGSQIHLNP